MSGRSGRSLISLADGDLVVYEVPPELLAVKDAVQKLKDDIESKHKSQNYVGFFMAINLETAKADLIPIPTKENMEKILLHMNELPQNVQKVVGRSIPEDDLKAAELIWDVLEPKVATEEKGGPRRALRLIGPGTG